MRDSNFELLRIICIFGIVTMHASSPLSSMNDICDRTYLNIINSLFNTCVSIFVLISGYFGIKFNAKKIVKLWFLTVFYCFVSNIVIHGDITADFSCITPIYSNRYWFITGYFLLMILSPYINYVADIAKKEKFCYFLITLIILLFIMPCIVEKDLFHSGGKSFPYMLCWYWMGRYIKLHVSSETLHNGRLWIGVFVFSTLMAIAGNAFLQILTNKTIVVFSRDCSVFMLLSALSVFFLFKNISFKSRLINYISQNVLAVYLLNECMIALVKKLFNPIFSAGTPRVYIYFPLFALLVTVLCMCTEEIRRHLVMAVVYAIHKLHLYPKNRGSRYCEIVKNQVLKLYRILPNRIG